MSTLELQTKQVIVITSGNTGTTSVCELRMTELRLGSSPCQVMIMMGLPGTHSWVK